MSFCPKCGMPLSDSTDEVHVCLQDSENPTEEIIIPPPKRLFAPIASLVFGIILSQVSSALISLSDPDSLLTYFDLDPLDETWNIVWTIISYLSIFYFVAGIVYLIYVIVYNARRKKKFGL